MVVCLYLWLSNGLVSCPPLMTDETGSDATAPPHSPCLPPTPTTLHSDRHYTVENEDELQRNSMYRNTGASVCSPPPGDSFFFVIFSDRLHVSAPDLWTGQPIVSTPNPAFTTFHIFTDLQMLVISYLILTILHVSNPRPVDRVSRVYGCLGLMQWSNSNSMCNVTSLINSNKIYTVILKKHKLVKIFKFFLKAIF